MKSSLKSTASSTSDKNAFNSKDLWWVPDDNEVWTLATQCSNELPNGLVNFLIERTQKVVALQKEKCLPAPATQIAIPEDLVYIPEVNPASILYCIRSRFIERKIYTNIGMVLMSINPFELIPGLYGKNMIKKYENPMDRGLPAHVYIVASRSFYNMCQSGLNQSILISGESGAGKTEATKQCLSFLADLAFRKSQKINHEASKEKKESSENAMLGITDRILFASPILEAFGNAKTLRNNNSSRFGKWMVLSFDQYNILHSSNIISYLLEKSRVTQRDLKERNYHIFYQILRGIDKETLRSWNIIPETRQYRFLATDNDFEAVDLDDAKTFQETYSAFLKVGFSEEETMSYFRIIAAILQLGNITFLPTRDGEACTIKNPEYVEFVATKLSVNQQVLAQSMISRSIESGKGRKSIISINLNPQKAQETRDTLARSIYDKLFNEIISIINLKNRESNNSMNAPARYIGLLDIFGFEIFTENSFEQLCINYCNEMLQYHFNFVIFTSEKNLYANEGIFCETIEFQDNTEVIREIEHIFKALDEEARIPKGTSKTWYDKLKRNFKAPCILFPTRRTGDIFVVKHYAGEVDYTPIEFMDKNIEVLNNDLFNAMASSKDQIVFRLFTRPPENMAVPETTNSSSSVKKSNRRSEGRVSLYDAVNEMGTAALAEGNNNNNNNNNNNSNNNGNNNNTVAPGKPPVAAASTLTNKSISWRFINQLNSLMTMLKDTQSHFIRCIKSNDACAAQRFDSQVVFKQLMYSGIFEVVKIQQSGLPCRLPHLEFVMRYRCLVPSKIRFNIHSSKELLSALIKHNNYDLKRAKVGTNLTFFSSTEQKLLENNRDILLDQSSTRISRFLQMKTRKFCYSFILKYFKEFHFYNADLLSEPATNAYHLFCSSCEKLNALVGYNILEHQMHVMKRHLDLLDARVELINEATGKVNNKTVEGILSLNEIIARAIELEITTHPIVVECKKIVYKYNRTLEFVDIIESTKNNGYDPLDQLFNHQDSDDDPLGLLSSAGEESGYSEGEGNNSQRNNKKKKKNRRMSLNGLSKQQLEECIASLTEFKDIIPVAGSALESSLQHKKLVEDELENIFKPLNYHFELATVMFDPYTGDLTLKNGDEGAESYLTLQKLVNQHEKTTFHGRDCTLLYEDCKNFIFVMEEYVASNEADEAMELIKTSSLGKTENPIFLNQLPEFHKWAEIQMAPQYLRDALVIGMIPKTDLGHENPIVYDKIQEVLHKLEEIEEPPPFLQTAIIVAHYTINLRKAFQEENWSSLDEIVEKATKENIDHAIFDDYPTCYDEIHDAHWQVVYHGFLNDLIYSISEPIISSITFDMDSWIVLVADLTEDLALIKEIKNFAHENSSPKLLALLPLFESILQLRSLLYSYEIEFVKKLMTSIQENHAKTIEIFKLSEPIQKEFEACEKLIRKVELENALNLCILSNMTPPYTYQVNPAEEMEEKEDEKKKKEEEEAAVAAAKQKEESAKAKGDARAALTALFSKNNNNASNNNNKSEKKSEEKDPKPKKNKKKINQLLKYHELFAEPTYSFQKNCEELEKILSSLQELSSTGYYKELNYKINYTKILLKGRKLLLSDELDMNLNYFEILLSYEKEIYDVIQANSLEEFQLLKLQMINQSVMPLPSTRRRTSITLNYQKEKEEEQKNYLKDENLFGMIFKEFQIICNEIFRRYLFADLCFILSSELISGTVDIDIHVNSELYYNCLKKFNILMEFIQQRFSTSNMKEILPIPAVPVPVAPIPLNRNSLAVSSRRNTLSNPPLPPLPPTAVDANATTMTSTSTLDPVHYLISKGLVIPYPEFIPIEYMDNLQALIRFTFNFLRISKIILDQQWEIPDTRGIYDTPSSSSSSALPHQSQSQQQPMTTVTKVKHFTRPMITNYQLIEILIEIENIPHGGAKEMKMIQTELDKIYSEIKARIAIRSLRYELENIKVENVQENQNNPNEMKRIHVNLKSLKNSIQSVEPYQGKETNKLKLLANHIVHVIELLLKNQIDKIHQKDLEKANQEYQELSLNNTNIEKVFHHVRIHNFLRELIDILTNNRQNIILLMKLIHNLQKSILRIISFENNPTNFKFILWLKAAYYYCSLCSIMEEKKNWIGIIECCNQLDEFIQIYLMPLLFEMLKHRIRATQESLFPAAVNNGSNNMNNMNYNSNNMMTNAEMSLNNLRNSISVQQLFPSAPGGENYQNNNNNNYHNGRPGSRNNSLLNNNNTTSVDNNAAGTGEGGGLDYTEDVIRFMEIIINLTKEGYQLALSLKLEKDEKERQKSLLSLSPIDSMKKEIREYDLSNNLYGIGHLQQAGYSNKQILQSSYKFDAKYLWAYNFDLSMVKRYSKYPYSARDLLIGGFKLKELYNSGFTPYELFETNLVNVNDLINIGLTINQLKESGIHEEIILKELLNSENKQLIIREISSSSMNFAMSSSSATNMMTGPLLIGLDGQPQQPSQQPLLSTSLFSSSLSSSTGIPSFNLQHLIKLGYKLKDLEEFDFTILELRSVGFSINEIYEYTQKKKNSVRPSTATNTTNNTTTSTATAMMMTKRKNLQNQSLYNYYQQIYSIQEFIKSGFPLKLLINLFPLKEFYHNSFTFQELRKLGVDNDEELYEAGYIIELEFEALAKLFQSTHGSFWKHKTNWNNYEKPLNTWFGIITAMDPQLGKERVVSIELVNNNVRGYLPVELCNLKKLERLRLSLNNISNEIPAKLKQFLLQQRVATDFLRLPPPPPPTMSPMPGNMSSPGPPPPPPTSSPKSAAIVEAAVASIPPFSPMASNGAMQPGELSSSFQLSSPMGFSSPMPQQSATTVGAGVVGSMSPPPTIMTTMNISALSTSQINQGGAVVPFQSSFARSMSSGNISIPQPLTTNQTHPHPPNASRLLQQDELEKERIALKEFYHSLQGRKWKKKDHWLSIEPISKWYGIKVNSSGHVIEIQLPSNNLIGNFPLSFNSFTHLKVLDVRLNQISGFIPSSLGECTKLERLFLQCNKLCGQIPESLANLMNLKILDLRSNLLNGLIANHFLAFDQLVYLGLHSNNFDQADLQELTTILPKSCKTVF